ncbi:30513_t:CDS:2, partial [Racocetra persica]
MYPQKSAGILFQIRTIKRWLELPISQNKAAKLKRNETRSATEKMREMAFRGTHKLVMVAYCSSVTG